MRWQSEVLKAIAQGVSWLNFTDRPNAGLRVLTYHTVGQKAHGDNLNLNTISVKQFKEHMDLLSDYRCVPLRGADFPTQGVEVAVTFDDGYSDNLHIVAPLLLQRSIPFTVFVTAQFVRDKVKGFMSEFELKELASLPGVKIGAHGNTHCVLTRCDELSLRNELASSRAYLEDLTGKSINWMSYPYGAVNQRVRAAVERCGYTLAATSYFNVNRSGRDPLMLCRAVVLNRDSCRVLAQKIRGNWDWYRFRIKDSVL